MINNTKRWLIIAGVQLQPSELAKLVYSLMTAYVFTLRKKYDDIVLMFISFLLLLPILALIYIQPHGSMSIIIITTWALTMFTIMKNQLRNAFLILIVLCAASAVLLLSLRLYIPGIEAILVGIVLFIFSYYSKNGWKKLLIGAMGFGLSLGLVISFAWNVILLDYQKNRINAFFNPSETSQDIGFNVDQSKVAIGSGQIWGKGWGFGTQSKLRFLPEYQTDFIFAAYSEEFGFVGSLSLLIIYFVIIFRLFFIALRNTSSNFEYVFVTGLAIKLSIEVFINVGTNTGLIPATGIPLPLMSAGGTNILITFFSLGLVQSIIATNTHVLKDSSYSVDNEDVLI
jgi:rod shape determining protein RodA